MEGCNVYMFFLTFASFKVYSGFEIPCQESVLTVKIVTRCPSSKEEQRQAAQRLNCLAFPNKCPSFEYHCVRNWNKTALNEVCAPSLYIVGGFCAEFNKDAMSIRSTVDSCSKFTPSCPARYNSTEQFKYPGCFEISTQRYLMEPDKTRHNIQGLSTGATIWVVVGSVGILLCLVLCFIYIMIRKKYCARCRKDASENLDDSCKKGLLVHEMERKMDNGNNLTTLTNRAQQSVDTQTESFQRFVHVSTQTESEQLQSSSESQTESEETSFIINAGEHKISFENTSFPLSESIGTQTFIQTTSTGTQTVTEHKSTETQIVMNEISTETQTESQQESFGTQTVIDQETTETQTVESIEESADTRKISTVTRTVTKLKNIKTQTDTQQESTYTQTVITKKTTETQSVSNKKWTDVFEHRKL